MANFKPSKVINGTHGKLWVNEELWAHVKSFEAKATGDFEDINICGSLGTYSKLKGWAGEGTITCHKYDSRVSKKLADAMKTGQMPEIKIVARLADPNSDGSERVEILDVVFTEFMVMNFASKEIVEEEVPFKFSDFNYLDRI